MHSYYKEKKKDIKKGRYLCFTLYIVMSTVELQNTFSLSKILEHSSFFAVTSSFYFCLMFFIFDATFLFLLDCFWHEVTLLEYFIVEKY